MLRCTGNSSSSYLVVSSVLQKLTYTYALPQAGTANAATQHHNSSNVQKLVSIAADRTLPISNCPILCYSTPQADLPRACNMQSYRQQHAVLYW